MPQGGGVSHCGLFPSGALGKGLYKLPITMGHSAPCYVCAHICMDGDSMGQCTQGRGQFYGICPTSHGLQGIKLGSPGLHGEPLYLPSHLAPASPSSRFSSPAWQFYAPSFVSGHILI